MEGASILVVEDEALIRLGALHIVEEAGFSTVEAANADEAIVLLERCPGITAVFTDINMPGAVNGLELLRIIRGRWPLIGLVVTSGRLPVQLPAGVQFISKPYTPGDIVAALQKCAA